MLYSASIEGHCNYRTTLKKQHKFNVVNSDYFWLVWVMKSLQMPNVFIWLLTNWWLIPFNW